MRTFNYFNYLPQRFTTDNERVLNVRRFIYAFKNGNRQATDYGRNSTASGATARQHLWRQPKGDG